MKYNDLHRQLAEAVDMGIARAIDGDDMFDGDEAFINPTEDDREDSSTYVNHGKFYTKVRKLLGNYHEGDNLYDICFDDELECATRLLDDYDTLPQDVAALLRRHGLGKRTLYDMQKIMVSLYVRLILNYDDGHDEKTQKRLRKFAALRLNGVLSRKHPMYAVYDCTDGNELRNIICATVSDALEEMWKTFGFNADDGACNFDNLNWINVKGVTDMNNLFNEYDRNGEHYENYAFNGDISLWDVSSVTDMEGMFEESRFNGDISEWDVRNVRSMKAMFWYSKFKQNISGWKIHRECVTTNMFKGCGIPQSNKPKTLMFEGFSHALDGDDIFDTDMPLSHPSDDIIDDSSTYSNHSKRYVELDEIFRRVDFDHCYSRQLTRHDVEVLSMYLNDACDDNESVAYFEQHLTEWQKEMLSIYIGIDDIVAKWRSSYHISYNFRHDEQDDRILGILQQVGADHPLCACHKPKIVEKEVYMYRYDTEVNTESLREYLSMFLWHTMLGREGNLNWLDMSDITSLFLVLPDVFNGNISEWNVSKVKSMSHLFSHNKVFNGDISKWDVSNVENMSCMFRNSKFNGDISKWNVRKVTSMVGMFEGSCFDGDISDWNVSSVQQMPTMFAKSRFDGDISRWNVESAVNMRYMFASSLFTGNIAGWQISSRCDTTKMFDRAEGYGWKCSIRDEHKPLVYRQGKTINEGKVYSRALDGDDIFDDDMDFEMTDNDVEDASTYSNHDKVHCRISVFLGKGFDFHKPRECHGLLDEADMKELMYIYENYDTFGRDTIKILRKHGLTKLNCQLLTTVYPKMDEFIRFYSGDATVRDYDEKFVDEWLNVNSKKHPLYAYYKPKDSDELHSLLRSLSYHPRTGRGYLSISLNWIDVSDITDMNSLFHEIDLKGYADLWDVSKVTDMSAMFYRSSFNSSISKWNVSNVENMYSMFDCSEFKGDLSAWNVRKVITMHNMFNMSKFNGNINDWNVENVKDMSYMFCGSRFNSDISKWRVGGVRKMTQMFGNAGGWYSNSVFDKDISMWQINAKCNVEGMFDGCRIRDEYKPLLPVHESRNRKALKALDGDDIFDDDMDFESMGNETEDSSVYGNMSKIHNNLLHFVNVGGLQDFSRHCDFSRLDKTDAATLIYLLDNYGNLDDDLQSICDEHDIYGKCEITNETALDYAMQCCSDFTWAETLNVRDGYNFHVSILDGDMNEITLREYRNSKRQDGMYVKISREWNLFNDTVVIRKDWAERNIDMCFEKAMEHAKSHTFGGYECTLPTRDDFNLLALWEEAVNKVLGMIGARTLYLGNMKLWTSDEYNYDTAWIWNEGAFSAEDFDDEYGTLVVLDESSIKKLHESKTRQGALHSHALDGVDIFDDDSTLDVFDEYVEDSSMYVNRSKKYMEIQTLLTTEGIELHLIDRNGSVCDFLDWDESNIDDVRIIQIRKDSVALGLSVDSKAMSRQLGSGDVLRHCKRMTEHIGDSVVHGSLPAVEQMKLIFNLQNTIINKVLQLLGKDGICMDRGYWWCDGMSSMCRFSNNDTLHYALPVFNV